MARSRWIRLLAALFAFALLAAACGDDGDAEADDDLPDPELSDDGGLVGPEPEDDDPSDPDEGASDPVVLGAQLTPGAEVPPVESPSSGEVRFTVEGTDVCIEATAVLVDDAVTDSHIHQAPAGENGGVVVAIGMPTGSEGDADTWDGCFDASAIIDELLADPTGFYFNVHSDAHPGGALRGQLDFA